MFAFMNQNSEKVQQRSEYMGQLPPLYSSVAGMCGTCEKLIQNFKHKTLMKREQLRNVFVIIIISGSTVLVRALVPHSGGSVIYFDTW
jgi:hypothetical protein